MLVAAIGTGAFDIAVCQKLPGFLIIVLFGNLLAEFTFSVQIQKQLGSSFVVYMGGSSGIMVKTDPKFPETLLHDVVVAVYHGLRRNPFFFSFYGDGYAMFIGSADIGDIPPLGTEIAYINIGWHIAPCQMSNVQRPIGIRQG